MRPHQTHLRPATCSAAGFDFTANMCRVCTDMIARLPELSHVDLSRMAVCFSQARKPVAHGLQATLTPMRFERGRLTTRRYGRKYTVQRLFDDAHREMLYILSFYLPRFLDLDLDEQLSTIVHELWHISPNFDGDLRRFDGRCYVHGRSQRQFDAQADRLARRWLACGPPEEVYGFLRLSFEQLVRRYGSVFGQKVTTPKLLPLAG